MNHLIWNVNPVFLSVGNFSIHWYGLLFAFAIIAGFSFLKYVYKKENLDEKSLDDFLFYCVLGILIGARLGHCLFYEPSYYLSNPLKILAIWEGGLASHGGGLGAIIAIFWYKRKINKSFLFLLDRFGIATAIFGIFVRIANFFNSEILGLPSNVSWAIVFQKIDLIPRHPVQLYEAFAYLISAVILFLLYQKTEIKRKEGKLFGLFLIFVFSSRFVIEYFKTEQATYNEAIFSTGQWLSIPFLLIGVLLIIKK